MPSSEEKSLFPKPPMAAFAVVEGFLQSLNISPPPWLVEEFHRRIVLLINHVLMQEDAATERLRHQKDRVVLIEWKHFSFKARITVAGLLDLADEEKSSDLTIRLIDGSTTELAEKLLQGDKPAVRIEGDVQLAADVNWLVDNLRWDIEEDISRIVGDTAAHTLVQGVKSMAAALRQFVKPGSGTQA